MREQEIRSIEILEPESLEGSVVFRTECGLVITLDREDPIPVLTNSSGENVRIIDDAGVEMDEDQVTLILWELLEPHDAAIELLTEMTDVEPVF